MGFETLELGWGLQGQKHLLRWQETSPSVALWVDILLPLFLNTGFLGMDF